MVEAASESKPVAPTTSGAVAAAAAAGQQPPLTPQEQVKAEREAAEATARLDAALASAATSSWLPAFGSDPSAALASLSTCHVNLHASCDFHAAEQAREYLEHWRHPAPLHCRRGAVASTPPVVGTRIDRGRLGVRVADLCSSDINLGSR